MIHHDKQTGRDIEVFITKDECTDPKNDQQTAVEVTKDGEWKAEIGCWFENDVLIDYDGVSVLNMYVIRALRAAGWTVPKDFEDDLK